MGTRARGPSRRDLQWLAARYAQSGCIRAFDPERRQADGAKYHKGYEVRISVVTALEAERLRVLVERLGLRAGRSYAKHRRVVVPIYGKDAVDYFSRFDRTTPVRGR